MTGLYYRPMSFPLRIVSVTDASFAGRETSFPQEAEIVLLMNDTHLNLTTKDYVDPKSNYLVGGYAHVLFFSASKAKRISHSTSHAETNAAVRGIHSAQLAACA